ncbi:At1g47710 [Linum perenne]
MDFSIRVAMETILDQLKVEGSGGDDENVIVSPASLDIVLRTVACGAKGKTLEQLLSFLGAKSIGDLNSKAYSTMKALRLANSSPSVPPKKRKRNYKYRVQQTNVSCANAIWVDERYSVKDSFKEILTEVYQAEANNVDFRNQKEEAVKKINFWAKKSTNGRINSILKPHDINKNKDKDDISLILTNAIYFKALWSNHLESSSSSSSGDTEYFHLIDGIDKVSVPFMYKGYTSFLYRKFHEFKVLELPYKCGKRDKGSCFSMYIFLPHKVDGLREMMSKFAGLKPTKILSQTLGGLKKVLMKNVVIPKWKSSYRFEAKDTIKKLGLRLPFDRNLGDLTEMLDGDSKVYVSEVIQRAYIDVDEKGTEAGAVSAAVVRGLACNFPETENEEEFVADHPFMFMIVERDSRAVIFAGAVFNPLYH